MGCLFFFMMFFDSSYLIGLFVKNDDYYESAHFLKDYLSHETILINSVVFVEVLNSLKMTKHGVNYENDLDVLFGFLWDDVVFHHLEHDDYRRSFELFKYYGQSINFSDCTILLTMIDYGVNKIVSFDSDFDKVNSICRIYCEKK